MLILTAKSVFETNMVIIKTETIKEIVEDVVTRHKGLGL